MLVRLDLGRSFFSDPFKQLPAKLQTIVWPLPTAGGWPLPGEARGQSTDLAEPDS